MSVFELKGDGEFLVAGLVDMGLLNESFFVEKDNPNPICRWEKAKCWHEIELQTYPGFNHVEGTTSYFNDVIHARNAVQGIGIIISDDAKTRLSPYVFHECAFLPINLLESPQNYWFMYITNILDCIDVEKSQFRTNRFSPKSVKYYSFDVEKIENTYLFRLPGHYDYLEDRDFATSRFLQLAKELDLKGFEFWECNKPGKDPIVIGVD
jgi:hypothetical protein